MVTKSQYYSVQKKFVAIRKSIVYTLFQGRARDIVNRHLPDSDPWVRKFETI